MQRRTSDQHDGGSGSAMLAKRRWTERDWDVAMEAQSFVAVFADAAPAPVTDNQADKKKTKKTTKKSNAKKTRSSKRSKAAGENDDAVADAEMEVVAAPTSPDSEAFWLAQLQDDVTEDMLEDPDAAVRVTWLNRVRDDASNGQRYEVAYDDLLDVQTILCHVYLVEAPTSNVMELTEKSAARVERSLRRTRGQATIEDAEDSEDETPPVSKRKSKRKGMKSGDDDDDDEGFKRKRTSGGSGRRVARAKMPKKVSKRIAAMHIPPLYTTVDLSKYTDRELRGDQAFDTCKGDLLSSNREIMRAVRTQNEELLTALVEDKSLHKSIFSFRAYQSVDVTTTALQYALEADDVKTVATMLQAHQLHNLSSEPSASLPSHSTGSHTSSYSDYNRRAINASRGGREGNNALLEDCQHVCSDANELKTFWSHPSSSVKMLTALHPTGEWVNGYETPVHVAQAARAGNYKLVSKMVEVLAKNGGWGYNDLHVAVLSTSGEELPTFRSVSVVKKAQQTKVTPFHFAAINPNVKYLESLWESVNGDVGDLRDDANYEPIHYAAANESPSAVQFLLEKKGNLLSRTKEKHTPLMIAIMTGREETAIAMLEFVASEGEEFASQMLSSRGPDSLQLIHLAASYNRLKVLEHLLKQGIDANVLASGQTTSLSFAARKGHFECVQLLLAHGAKVDRADKLKRTPLLLAVKNGHTHIAAYLINRGANVNAYDSSENSVVHYAASYGWMSCLELLFDAGADIWSRNSWGFVPLICAMLKQRMVCVDFILGSDSEQRFLDFRDRSGCTMLFLQCQHSTNLDQIKFLLEKGLDPNIGNCDGERPLSILIKRAQSGFAKNPTFYLGAIRALVEHGADVNLAPEPVEEGEPRRPNQPLHTAIRFKLKPIFDYLLGEAGADPLITESNGGDAWSTSISLGFDGTEYLEVLLDRFPEPRTFSENIFHAIAASGASAMVRAATVEKLMARCLNVSELLHEANWAGLTPLMALYQAERPVPNHFNKSVDYKDLDEEYSKICGLFASAIADIEALKKYVSVRQRDISLTSGVSAPDNDDNAYVRVLDSTIFHIASQRSLKASQWHGDNLVELILQIFPASKALVDVPTRNGHETPLLMVLERGDKKTARLLLESGANPNYSPDRCKECTYDDVQCATCASRGYVNTPLVKAVQRRNIDQIKLLLEFGATPDCCLSGSKDTPLHLAMRAGDTEQTKLLMSHQASMITPNGSKATALASAISAKMSVTKRKPHEGEIKFTQNAFGSGAKPTPRQVSLLLNKAEDTSDFASISASSAPGTVIDIALEHDAALAAVLLGDRHHRTPLHHAAATRDLPLLRSLLQRVDAGHKAEALNKRDIYGRTTLHFALNSVSMSPDASFDVERFLLLAGANAHAVDNFGLSSLHFALAKINMDWHHKYESTLGQAVVAEQKALGTYEATKADAFKRHLFAASDSVADPVETVSNLIAAGCDPHASDALGRTPMHLASSIGAFVCASILLSASPASSRNALLEQEDIDSFTPLGRAFERGRETAITTLIQSGASVSKTVTIRGEERSYFSVAVEKSMWGICHMLLNAGFSRRQAVEDAVRGNRLQLAKNLMVGLEISNDRALLIAGNNRGQTLLHVLAINSASFDDLAAELAWALVDDGLDVSKRDLDGNTVLHYAATNANTKLMDFVLHHACNVNDRNQAGHTPLMHALQSGSKNDSAVLQYMLTRPELDLHLRDPTGLDTLAQLVKHSLDRFARDAALITWLELALQRHGELNELYRAGSLFPSEDFSSNSKLNFSSNAEAPLIILVTYAPSMDTRLQLLRALLQNGASPNSVDSNGNTVLMHLAVRNMLPELALVLHESKASSIDLRTLVNVANYEAQQRALHLAVQPLEYGSFENVKMIELLVDGGASIDAKDSNGETVIDYAARQASRVVFRFLKSRYPALVQSSENEVFDTAMEDDDDWTQPPSFDVDAEEFVETCAAAGKIVKTRVSPEVDDNCDVGQVSSAFGLLDDATGEVVEGEEYDALLTKVDVKHGQFGVNVFYRTQIVLDELQSIYIVFTNWGRIGEEGKFQNTPFHSAAEAVTEFKKIFKSKTSNAWEDRHAFEKRRGKYSLVDRVKHNTTVDHEVTESFTAQMETFKRAHKTATNADAQLALFAPVRPGSLLEDSGLVNTLFAISDVRHLQLAASEDCQFYNDLPLARDTELRSALEMLQEIRLVLEEQAEVKLEISKASANLATDEGTADALAELSDKYAELAEDVSERSSRYFEIVPCNESYSGSAIRAFDDVSKIDKEVYRLKKLLDITHTYKMLLGAKLRAKTIHPMEYVLNALQIGIERLPVADHERKLATKYFFSGLRPSARDRYRVSNVFEVNRKGEAERLKTCLQNNPEAFASQHTAMLWHGTRRTNLMGIVSEGLRIAPAEAPHNGYAYGKGIYFSDVAAKSLQYCNTPYTIEEEVEEEETTEGQPKTRTRTVQYMLLCEVALGKQRDVASTRSFERESLASEGYHSIRAMGQHVPNPSESIVSPVSGVKVPVGEVGRPGRDFATASAWATKPTRDRDYYNYNLADWTLEAETYLNELLGSNTSDLKAGTIFKIERQDDKKLFTRKGYYNSPEENAQVEVHITHVHALGSSASMWDVAVDIIVTPPTVGDDNDEAVPASIVVATARRYHNVRFDSPPKLDKGFSLTQPSAAGEYNEHVVFAIEQARIRYLVEVETINGRHSFW